ncbi:MAG TPA: DUF3857 and transglutaminase domain-containing protein [Gemmatimonadales bacterium]|nr:DUF3857 and transglutaminase domain-containing protein [Gemmatimonadales bacterium]
MPRSHLLLLLAVVAAPLAGQAPVITPDGDPSVRSDTIYALAVDPAAHPGESAAYLLDDGVIRIERDGTISRTYRQVIQILTEDAVKPEQEWSFSWHPGYESFRLNWIRVVRPDGTVISAGPSQQQVTDVPAEMGDPEYSDQKVLRLSLSGVAVGTEVDYSTTTVLTKPFLPGDFLLSWSISNGLTTRRSRYIVEAPAGLKLRLEEHNLDFARRSTTRDGRQELVWAAADLSRIKSESFADYDTNAVMMGVKVGSPETWSDIGRWYAGLARDRYVVTPLLRAKVQALVAGAHTLDDSIRAIHRFVAQDIRYVSIDFGIGGYRPRLPDSVLTTGFGDCKDKATLFITALKAIGVRADPVLLRSTGHVDPELPALDQFDHEIAVVERGPARVYTDLTTEFRPYGELPSPEQGQFGLIVHADGSTEQIRFPEVPVIANVDSLFVAGTLSPAGVFNGYFRERAAGSSAVDLRQTFVTPYDSTDRAKFEQRLAQGWFTGTKGDSLVIFDGKDLAAVPQVKLALHDGVALEKSGDTRYLRLPFGDVTSLATTADRLEAEPDGPRRFPIVAVDAVGNDAFYREFRVVLPSGWRAELPQGVTATSAFGEYRSGYQVEGDTLVLTRWMAGVRGVAAPQRLGELTAWLRAVAKDNARFIVLDPPPASP